MKVITEKENGVFSLQAEGIKTQGDIKEVIHQLQLIEGQITDGLAKYDNLAISEGIISLKASVKFPKQDN